ncbi:lipopolysaccharide biosynthesis protein [Segetibacter aerophilus]|uniref:lipopolysaccharide biosynthesis protein n=1 Tax=Segetibacter aerophilus TaxID=670293 RepID=UPI0011BD9BEB|nr:oligosaccharide flippase family protein [Segetibacter aerophilus]
MKTVYLDSFFGLLNKFFYYGLRVLIIFLFSEKATTTDFATFIYVLNIVEIARLLLDFGIDSTYTRNLARMSDEEAKECVEIIISQKLLLSIFSSGVMVTVFYFSGITNVSLLVSTAFILPLISANSFVNIFFQSKNNNRILSGYYITAFLLSGLMIYMFSSKLEYYFIYALMEIVFFMILTYAVYRKTNFKLKFITFTEMRKTYQTSLYNGSSQTVVTIYSKTDLLFIQKLSSAINVAYYGFFMRIMDPLLMVASALATSAYSFFSKEIDSKDKPTIKRNLRQYLLVTFIYACFILAVITFLLPFLLEVIKSKYKISSSIAFFFGLATAIRIISAAQGSILLSMGKFNYTFKIALINICSLFPFYFVLIPMFNIRGVLLSIVASELICVVIKLRTLKPILF